MNKADEKVKEYLERATKIYLSQGLYVAMKKKEVYSVIVEIAKMIQLEEYTQERKGE